ncbi:ABC transporter substrate-binding protein, partial [Mesorhizobium sp. M5C.F.Ca.IN.020.14.1.1]
MASMTGRTVLATAFAAVLAFASHLSAANAGDMRIAFGDLPGIESIQT